VYILIFLLWLVNWKKKVYAPNDSKHSYRVQSEPNFSWLQLWFVWGVPKYRSSLQAWSGPRWQTANRTSMTNTYCVYTVSRYSWWRTVDTYSTSSNKFQKLWILLAFIIKIYHDPRSSECQRKPCMNTCNKFCKWSLTLVNFHRENSCWLTSIIPPVSLSLAHAYIVQHMAQITLLLFEFHRAS